MIKILYQSVREFKKSSAKAPIFVTLEVIMECIIPFITALLINEIKAGCEFSVILFYGAVLIILAGFALYFGKKAGMECATAACGFAHNLRKDMFYKIQDFSFENIDKLIFKKRGEKNLLA